MNRFTFLKRKYLTYFFTAVLTAVLIMLTSTQTYAENPSAAYIHHAEGSGLLVGTGADNNGRKPAKNGDRIRGNRTLKVPGERLGWANLGFVFESSVVSDHAGLLVQAGPHALPSEWSFPCTAKGGFRIAWKRGNNRGCEEGVRLQASKGLTNLSFNQENYTVQNVKNVLKAQVSEEVTVAPPSSEPTLIQVYESDTGIKVETIEGDILVKSTQNPQGRLIPEGKRYSYPQDTIEDIDRDAIVNSPEMQDFLNPDNWSSPNIPQRVVDGVVEQLGEHRTALGLPTQPSVASSGKSWSLEVPRYQLINDRCFISNSESTTLVQTGNLLNGKIIWKWNEQLDNATITGTIESGIVQMTITPPAIGGFPIVLEGRLTQNDEVVGTATAQGLCNGISGPFRMLLDTAPF